MSNLMQDPMISYAVALIIFLALAYHFGRKPALGWIDGEIKKISAELDSARQLRAEAEAALADCKAKQARAEADAVAIVTKAQKQAEAMRKQAAADLAASLTRQQQLSIERIHIAESEAIASVRAAVVSEALAQARKSLADNLSEGDSVRLVDQAIADIPALKATKAKAA